jgi:hypothetical protein
MHKKIGSYSLIAFVIIVIAMAHNVLGNHGGLNPALATVTSYEDDTAIPPEKLRLIRTVGYRADNLLEMNAQDVRALLRNPEMVREDVPVMIWQYRTAECVLDIYFEAQDESDMEAPVIHYEIRERRAKNYSVRKNCVRDLINRETAPRMVDVSVIYKR